MNSSRIEYIDLAKGICITLVVFEHVWMAYPGMEKPYIVFLTDAIRMPLYYFLSGLFFKQYEGFGGFLKRKVNKLLIPFFFFYLTFTVILHNVPEIINGGGIKI